jgi:hypothetical protein
LLEQSFTGGVLLTLLSDTMMPEAFTYGDKQVGFVATSGFALAFITTIWLRYGPTLGRHTVVSGSFAPCMACR